MVNSLGSGEFQRSQELSLQEALAAFAAGNLNDRVIRIIAQDYSVGRLGIEQIERVILQAESPFVWTQLLPQIVLESRLSDRLMPFLSLLARVSPDTCISLLFDQEHELDLVRFGQIAKALIENGQIERLLIVLAKKRAAQESLQPLFYRLWEHAASELPYNENSLQLCVEMRDRGYLTLEGSIKLLLEEFYDKWAHMAEGSAAEVDPFMRKLIHLTIQYFPEQIRPKNLADWFVLIPYEELYAQMKALISYIGRGYNPFRERDWAVKHKREPIFRVLDELSADEVNLSSEAWEKQRHILKVDCLIAELVNIREELDQVEKEINKSRIVEGSLLRKRQETETNMYRLLLSFVKDLGQKGSEEDWEIFANVIKGREEYLHKPLIEYAKHHPVFSPFIKKIASLSIERQLETEFPVSHLVLLNETFLSDELYLLLIDRLEQLAQDSQREEWAEQKLAEALATILGRYGERKVFVSENVLLSLYDHPFVHRVLCSGSFKEIFLSEIQASYTCNTENEEDIQIANHILAKLLLDRPKRAKKRLFASKLFLPISDRWYENCKRRETLSFEKQLQLFAVATCKVEAEEILARIDVSQRIPFAVLVTTFPAPFIFSYLKDSLYGEVYLFPELRKELAPIEEIQEEIKEYCLSLIAENNFRDAIQLYEHTGQYREDLEERIFTYVQEGKNWQLFFRSPSIPHTMAAKIVKYFLSLEMIEGQREGISNLIHSLISQYRTDQMLELVVKKFPEHLDKLLEDVWETASDKAPFRSGVKSLYSDRQALLLLVSRVKDRYADHEKVVGRRWENKLSLLVHLIETLFEHEAALPEPVFPVLSHLFEEKDSIPLIEDSMLWKKRGSFAAQLFRLSVFLSGFGDMQPFETQYSMLQEERERWTGGEETSVESASKRYKEAVKAVARSLAYIKMTSSDAFRTSLSMLQILSRELLESEKEIYECINAGYRLRMSRNPLQIACSDRFIYVDSMGRQQQGTLNFDAYRDFTDILAWLADHPEPEVGGEKYKLNRMQIIQDWYAASHNYTLPEEDCSDNEWKKVAFLLLNSHISLEDRNDLVSVLRSLQSDRPAPRVMMQRKKIVAIFREARKERSVDELALRLSNSVNRCADGLDQVLEELIVRFLVKTPDCLGGKISKLITRYKQKFIDDHGDKRAFIPGEYYAKRYGEPNTMIPRVLKERLRIAFILPGEPTDIMYPNYYVYRFAQEGLGFFPEHYEIPSVINRFFAGGELTLTDADNDVSYTQRFAPFTKEFLVNMIREDLNKQTGDPSKVLCKDTIYEFLQQHHDEFLMKEFDSRLYGENCETSYFDPYLNITNEGIERILWLLGYLEEVPIIRELKRETQREAEASGKEAKRLRH